MPASPWIGSTRNAAVRGVMAFASASASPYGMVDSPAREWSETVAILRLRRQAGGRDRPPVEVTVAADDLGASVRYPLDLVAPLARRLDRRLDGLGAAAGGQHAVETRQLREALEQERQFVVVIRTRRDAKLLRLGDQRADDPRVAMAKAHRRVRAHQVEEAAAVDVGQPTSLAARQNHRQWVVIAGAKRLFATDQVGGSFRNRGCRVTAHTCARCHRVLQVKRRPLRRLPVRQVGCGRRKSAGAFGAGATVRVELGSDFAKSDYKHNPCKRLWLCAVHNK